MAGQICRFAAAVGVALGGITLWFMAAVSRLPGDGASLWVTLGAALVMTGMGLAFLTLHPRRAPRF